MSQDIQTITSTMNKLFEDHSKELKRSTGYFEHQIDAVNDQKKAAVKVLESDFKKKMQDSLKKTNEETVGKYVTAESIMKGIIPSYSEFNLKPFEGEFEVEHMYDMDQKKYVIPLKFPNRRIVVNKTIKLRAYHLSVRYASIYGAFGSTTTMNNPLEIYSVISKCINSSEFDKLTISDKYSKFVQIKIIIDNYLNIYIPDLKLYIVNSYVPFSNFCFFDIPICFKDEYYGSKAELENIISHMLKDNYNESTCNMDSFKILMDFIGLTKDVRNRFRNYSTLIGNFNDQSVLLKSISDPEKQLEEANQKLKDYEKTKKELEDIRKNVAKAIGV